MDWRIYMSKKPVINVKMSVDELREYIAFKHRGSYVPAKKGKGTIYSRKRKHKNKEEEQ